MESRKRQNLLRQLIFQVRLISKKSPVRMIASHRAYLYGKSIFYNNLLEPSIINMVYPNISPMIPMIIPTFSISFC